MQSITNYGISVQFKWLVQWDIVSVGVSSCSSITLKDIIENRYNVVNPIVFSTGSDSY